MKVTWKICIVFFIEIGQPYAAIIVYAYFDVIEIIHKTGNFCQKSNFLSKIEIFVKNQNIRQKLKFSKKKTGNFRQKSKFSIKLEILIKHQ